MPDTHTCCLEESEDCVNPCDCGYSHIGCMGCSACNEARDQWHKAMTDTEGDMKG